MPRMPRFFVPNLPLHIIQRGNNRLPIVAEPEDLQAYRECLTHAALKYDVAIHAYVLMSITFISWRRRRLQSACQR